MAKETPVEEKRSIIFMIKRPRPELHGAEEIRRFEVLEGISYRKLHRRVRKAFGLTSGFDLAFDEHNTTITMTDDQDMRHVTERSQREFQLNSTCHNQPEQEHHNRGEPLVWMVIVPSHNLGERWIMKAVRWVAKGGRVVLITAASVITLVAPLIPLLPVPQVAAIAAIAAAATAITTASQQSSSSSLSQEQEQQQEQRQLTTSSASLA
ncbi:hypothetical protein BDB00DRAFT_790047 [Zychaea mexicana]|uniref:uncharacterized protein n=1 Tax=Zychaea mexicana TaxID=64656 RepID=UPI0022FDE9DB|nr:uncharacterized protein BDB00DRAFT_790047 [Zychaea mexicana]KAI9490804.1 hypothetical protein BDB00DRAFT_790047 [Zychaea mexicana]